jgi:hypothetical protein
VYHEFMLAWSGELIGLPDVEADMMSLARHHMVDQELLSHGCLLSYSTDRSAQTVVSLKRDLTAWSKQNRKWSPTKTYGQVSTAVQICLGYTKADEGNRTVWSQDSVLGGIFTASSTAAGKLLGSKALPKA